MREVLTALEMAQMKYHGADMRLFVEASRRFDRFLVATIADRSKTMSEDTEEKPASLAVPSVTRPALARPPHGDDVNPLGALCDMLDEGVSELNETARGLMDRLQEALPKGRENLVKMRGHVEKIEKRVETIDQFNKRMSNE
jgi:hypothetical protein